MEARKITDDTYILPSYAPFPGFGLVPANAFLIKAAQPMLVDTGMFIDRDAFLGALRSLIDPQELQWIWLTHPDPDHIGSLKALMEEVPHIRLITTFMGYGMMTLTDPPALDRIRLLNPGEMLDLGDRSVVALRPPTFDNPATTGLFDTKSRALFSSDSFGGIVQREAAYAEDLPLAEVLQGQQLWTQMDSPWLHRVDEQKFGADLKQIEALEPSWLLSSHLPPSSTLTGEFLRSLAAVPASEPFIGPDQAALEAMLASMGQVSPA